MATCLLQTATVTDKVKVVLLVFTIEIDCITRYIPASTRVYVDSDHLRVEYDDVVQLSDLVVANVSSKLVSNIPSKARQNTLRT